jgi:hypothetical protein
MATKIAFFLGLKRVPVCRPLIEQERAAKRAQIEALLAEIRA